MHPVKNGQAVSLEKVRRGDIGTQHALFDQLVRVVAHHRHNGLDFALLIEDDAGFHRLEIDGAALIAGSPEHTIETMQTLQIRHPLIVHIRMGALLQHFTHLGVGQARMGMDYRFIKLRFAQFTGAAQFHLTDHCQTVYLWLERAQPIRQGLRQHGHHPLGEVHGVAALGRLLVQR